MKINFLKIKQYIDSKINDLPDIVRTASYDDLEDKPSIPEASSTTPVADTTNGATGNGTTWARSNHSHPKSSLYAEAEHEHEVSNLKNTNIIPVIVTYMDDSTETLSIITYEPKFPLVIIIDSDDDRFTGVAPFKARLLEDNQAISEVDFDSSEYQFIFNDVPYGEYRCMIGVQFSGGTGYGYVSIIYDANHYEYHSKDLTITYGNQ